MMNLIHAAKLTCVLFRYSLFVCLSVGELLTGGTFTQDALTAEQALTQAAKLTDESLALLNKAKPDEAIPLFERALALREKFLPANDPLIAAATHNLAEAYARKSNFAKAEPLFKRALAIREEVLGKEAADTGTTLNTLGSLYQDMGRYAEAEPLYLRSLAIREKTLGAESSSVANTLNNLGVFYMDKGDFALSEKYGLRALEIREKTAGPDSAATANSLQNLAVLYSRSNAPDKAEPLYLRAIAIREKTLGPDHPQMATSLLSLAGIYRDKGDYVSALPLSKRALAIYEKSGPDGPQTANATSSLALTYKSLGDFAKAEPLYRRTLAIREKALGAQHPAVAAVLNTFGLFYLEQHDYANAEPLLLRALAIREKALNADSPDLAASLANLATLYTDRSEFERAESLHLRALAIREKTLGKDNPVVAQSLVQLAILHEAKGEPARAIALRARANDIREYHLRLNLDTGSERQRLAYFDKLRAETNAAISLNAEAAPQNAAALQAALQVVLQRKGRTLDAIAADLSALRARLNAEDQLLLDQYADTRARLAQLWLSGSGRNTAAQHQAAIQTVEAQREALERTISARSAAFRTRTQPVTVAAVQTAIPRNAALVEFVNYRPTLGQRVTTAAPHYAAYVLRTDSVPKLVKIGAASQVDLAVDALRKALRNPQSKDVKRLARIVDKLVLQPVRAVLSDVQHLLIAPDGQLNLLPFAALADEKDQWLIERYQLTYLTSGRDLLREPVAAGNRALPLLIAAPAFGLPATLVDSKPSANDALAKRQQADLTQVFFDPLPGAASEVRGIRALLPQATVLTGDQATETALKQTRGPRLLHIATHGFFLSEDPPAPAGTRTADLPRMGKWIARVPNPLLRSGLALAGANQGKRSSINEDDGVLTALEAAGLDLWGTKLVVLSACDTGVGEVRNGDGVYGLRRALVLAGAESQLMSLWPVADRTTRDLMVAVYRGLQIGQGRGAALRNAQLQMLRDKTRQHPYYWASFIQSGEWANLEGKR